MEEVQWCPMCLQSHLIYLLLSSLLTTKKVKSTSSNSKSQCLSDIFLVRLLKSVSMDKDMNKKRDVIKKVIAYMTLGIDVSRLYPEMVKASRTEDIVMKKMIYLYLINYAE